MEQQDPAWQRQRAREALLFHFLKAYDEGNLEVFGAILQQAENDPELDTLIWAVFPAYLRDVEHIHTREEEEKEQLSAIIQQPLPRERMRSELLPLTVADVAARLQVDLILYRATYTDPHSIQAALDILVRSHDLLPDHLDLCVIQTIFSEYMIVVPPAFYSVFLGTACSLQEKRATKQKIWRKII